MKLCSIKVLMGEGLVILECGVLYNGVGGYYIDLWV